MPTPGPTPDPLPAVPCEDQMTFLAGAADIHREVGDAAVGNVRGLRVRAAGYLPEWEPFKDSQTEQRAVYDGLAQLLAALDDWLSTQPDEWDAARQSFDEAFGIVDCASSNWKYLIDDARAKCDAMGSLAARLAGDRDSFNASYDAWHEQAYGS